MCLKKTDSKILDFKETIVIGLRLSSGGVEPPVSHSGGKDIKGLFGCVIFIPRPWNDLLANILYAKSTSNSTISNTNSILTILLTFKNFLSK